LADGPRLAVDESARLETRERERELAARHEREMAANREWLDQSIAADREELPQPEIADPPQDDGRELSLEMIGDLIAEVMAKFVTEQIRAAKVELLSEINAARLENIKEQSESVRQQKVLLGEVQELLAKLRQREFGGAELPASLN
jgi:hypothetical protein